MSMIGMVKRKSQEVGQEGDVISEPGCAVKSMDNGRTPMYLEWQYCGRREQRIVQ
jgi:hypothetical protein